MMVLIRVLLDGSYQGVISSRCVRSISGCSVFTMVLIRLLLVHFHDGSYQAFISSPWFLSGCY